MFGRPGIIFRGAGKRIKAVEKAAWHPGVEVFFQNCAWADAAFCLSWINHFRRALQGIGRPEEQSILFADNLHAQTTPEFKTKLMRDCNMMLPLGHTDEVQPVDAGYARRIKVLISKLLEMWLLEGDNAKRWDSNKLSAGDRRILLTHWVAEAVAQIDAQDAYRKRLFPKTGLAITADGTEDDHINLKAAEGPYTFMDTEHCDEPIGDILPISPAPADEEHPARSSDEEDDEDEEGGGNAGSASGDGLAFIDDDDDLDDDEEEQPLVAPAGYRIVALAPKGLHSTLVKRHIIVRMGMCWVKGFIT